MGESTDPAVMLLLTMVWVTLMEANSSQRRTLAMLEAAVQPNADVSAHESTWTTCW
jgi:hypothetical protein